MPHSNSAPCESYSEVISAQSEDRLNAIRSIESLVEETPLDDTLHLTQYYRDLAMNYARLPEQDPKTLGRALELGNYAVELADLNLVKHSYQIDPIGNVKTHSGAYIGADGTLLDPSHQLPRHNDEEYVEKNAHAQTLSRHRDKAAANFIVAMAGTRLSMTGEESSVIEASMEQLKIGCNALTATKQARRVIGDTRPDQFEANWFARIRMMSSLLDAKESSPHNATIDMTYGAARAWQLAGKSENPDELYGAAADLSDEQRRKARTRARLTATGLFAFSLTSQFGHNRASKAIAKKLL